VGGSGSIPGGETTTVKVTFTAYSNPMSLRAWRKALSCRTGIGLQHTVMPGLLLPAKMGVGNKNVFPLQPAPWAPHAAGPLEPAEDVEHDFAI